MKRDVLFKANYTYNFDRDLFVNRAAKKAFSAEYVDDHPEKEIVSAIAESTNGNGWTFYFNSQPTEGSRRELERSLS